LKEQEEQRNKRTGAGARPSRSAALTPTASAPSPFLCSSAPLFLVLLLQRPGRLHRQEALVGAVFPKATPGLEGAGDFNQAPDVGVLRADIERRRLIGREALHPERRADRLRAGAVLLG